MQIQNNSRDAEIEKALHAYIKTRDVNVCYNIFVLYEPIITKAFWNSFKNPYIYKEDKEEVRRLKEVFSQEAFIKFYDLLIELTSKASAEAVNLFELRLMLTIILYKRVKSDVYREVAGSELPGYPINITPEERSLYNAEKEFKDVYGRDATDEELAKFMNHRVSTVKNYRQIRNCRWTTSLDKNYSDDPADSSTLGDNVASEYADYQPEHVVAEMFSADIDAVIKSVLTDREYRRIRMRYENEGISEMDMAKMELGEDADPKKLSACQRSINRDLNSAYKKLRIPLMQYTQD